MDLIYYYSLRMDAPANVARNIFGCLLKRREELPFENIKLFVESKYAKEMVRRFSDFEVVTYKNINNVSKNCVIHIPLSPLVYPNGKFLLHLLAVLKRKKLILQYHGDIRIERQFKLKPKHFLDILSIPSYIIVPYLLRTADKLIVHSYFMSNLVISEYGVKNSVVIPNGVDDFWFEESDIPNIKLDGDPNLFYHGRLSPEKGVDLLIKGFAEVISENSKAKLYVSGEGSQREQLEKLCAKLGIQKNVIFLGYTTLNDLESYLKNTNAAIYPSIYEPFSLAILEAFSSVNGPVYFSKQAGINDFVLRNEYNLNAFEPTVENISKIIKNVIDRNYDKRVVKQQKEFAKRYTWDKVIKQYIKVYKEILK